MPPCPVKLILGPAKSGKTERALARYRAALKERLAELDRPANAWIGPTISTLNDVRDRLVDSLADAYLAPGLTTFAMLADEIIAGGPTCRHLIGPLEKLRLLSHIARQLAATKKLRHFATVAHAPGFSRQVAATIADLKRRDVTPETFRKIARDASERDFAAIFTEYQRHLAASQLLDAEERFWSAWEELAKSSLRWGTIVIDGFADFTLAQHDLLRRLAEHCEELIITLPMEHSDANNVRELLFNKPSRTRALLAQSFPHLTFETTKSTQFASPGLKFIEQYLFSDKIEANVSRSVEGLTLVAPNSIHGEIRHLARRIKQLIANDNVVPDHIAVIFPSLADVADRVEEVFADFGLPLALDHQKSLATKPLARIGEKLLQLHEGDWPFNVLLDVINQLDFDASRGALERSVRLAQLPSGRTALFDQLQAWADTASDESEPTPGRRRKAREAHLAAEVFMEWQDRLAILPQLATIKEFTTSFAEVLRRFGVLNHTTQSDWTLFEKAFSRIAATDATFSKLPQEITSGEFLELWQTIASTVMLPSASDVVGRVRVVAAEMARTLTAEHVFLAGVSEQSYSSLESSSRLFDEHQITRFLGDSRTSKQVVEQQAGDSLLLFYDMLTRANRSLTISYTALDDKGQALSPSPLVTEIERCVAPLAIPNVTMPLGESVAANESPSSLTDWRLTSVATALENRFDWLAGLLDEPTTRNVGRSILRGIESVSSRSDREIFGPFEGLLLSPEARAQIANRFDGEHLWSPSQLETYAFCPYQFFAKHLLRLEPLPELALRSDHLRRGTLLHQVLAAVHEQQTDIPPNEQELLDRFVAALARVIEQEPLKGLAEALREIERREILEWAPRFAEQEMTYRERWQNLEQPLKPTHFEVRFGPKASDGATTENAVSTLIPFTLDLGGEQIKLTGQIDRIDMGRVGGVTVFNIIDYKSGQEVKLAEHEIKAGRQLQLPLYALAAEKLLFSEQRAIALATGYWSIKAGGFATGRDTLLEFRTVDNNALLDSPRWTDVNNSLLKRVAEIIRGIRAAEFPVHSDVKDCTRYCEFSKICRIAQIRSLEKAWIAPITENQTPTAS